MLSAVAFKKITGVARDADKNVLIKHLGTQVERETLSATAQCLIIAELVEVWTWSAAMGGKSVGLSQSTAKNRASIGKVLRFMPDNSVQISYTYAAALSADTRDAIRVVLTTCETDEESALHVYRTFVETKVAQALQSTPENHAKVTARIIEKGLRTVTEITDAIPSIAKDEGITMPKREAAASNAGDKKADTTPTMAKAAEAMTAFVADRQKGSDKDNPFKIDDTEATLIEESILRMVLALLADGRIDQVEAIRAEITDALKDAETTAADRAAGAAVAADLKANAMGVRANA